MVSLHEVKFINLHTFFRYITLKVKQEAKDKIYRSYLTGCLRLIVSNTAKMGGGSVIKKSYDDIIEKIDKTDIYTKKVETKENADQIVANTVAKLGLRLIDNTRKGENKQ